VSPSPDPAATVLAVERQLPVTPPQDVRLVTPTTPPQVHAPETQPALPARQEAHSPQKQPAFRYGLLGGLVASAIELLAVSISAQTNITETPFYALAATIYNTYDSTFFTIAGWGLIVACANLPVYGLTGLLTTRITGSLGAGLRAILWMLLMILCLDLFLTYKIGTDYDIEPIYIGQIFLLDTIAATISALLSGLIGSTLGKALRPKQKAAG
jgi:hypothetical protein